ncbi:AAA family ATPase [Granulicoccus phenolivorans]|uniref:AAA family ATPase n=1 Tax=Granulicoccus phenolivorans TaxID=266854 RepID=UPI0006846053|nr:AAA family ATPase [Granulicoccus phenolivorans]
MSNPTDQPNLPDSTTPPDSTNPPGANSGPDLSDALDRLAAIGEAAGIDRTAARAEGMALAAAVAEANNQAFVDFADELGEQPSAVRFMELAQHGRKWRSAPTALLSELIATKPNQAPAYAKMLGTVAMAACTLGQPGPRAAGNAQAAAAAQQSALPHRPRPRPAEQTPPIAPGQPTPGSVTPGQVPPGPAAPGAEPPQSDFAPSPFAPSDPGTTSAQEFARTAPAVLNQVLGKLNSSIRRQREDLAQQRSPLDLDPGLPLGPGAFGGLPGSAFPTPNLTPTPDPFPDFSGVTGQPTAPDQPAPAATASADQAAAEPEPEPEEERSLEDLLAELDGLTGLATVKEEIHRQSALLRVEAMRIKAGLKSPTVTRHLVFVGNPGTGKTTVARLVAGIYRALGLLSKGQLIEVDRSELVAGYLGQTALKTAEVVKSAEGGVLFIDEAYALSGDQYGTEAINTLVKEMEDKRDDLVVIVAGYPVPMAVFIAENPGLTSRFRTTIDFADYTDDELVSIFTGMVSGADYDAPEETVQTFRDLLAEQVRDSTFGNGRFARNCMEAAVGAHAWRLREVAEPTLEQLRTLLPEDLRPAEEEAEELPDLSEQQPKQGPLEAPEELPEETVVDFGPDAAPDSARTVQEEQ